MPANRPKKNKGDIWRIGFSSHILIYTYKWLIIKLTIVHHHELLGSSLLENHFYIIVF